jgi:hypothetical protein
MTHSAENLNATFTSAAQAIYAAIQYTDKKHFSLADVMGLTSHAFRININPKNVDVAGPTSFNPDAVLARGLKHLGFTSDSMAYFKPATPEQLGSLIAFAQKSIDRGIPVIGWDLFIPEFGLIYGYDDEKQVLYAKDIEMDGPIPYADFGNIRTEIIWMMSIEDAGEIHLASSLRQALEMIIEHSRGKENYPHSEMFKDYAYGLSGYDAWIQAFEAKSVEVFGNAYNTEVVSDAREYAVRFLRGIAELWTLDIPEEQEVKQLAAQAAKYYEEVASALVEMRGMYPMPNGGEPNDPENAKKTIELLRTAKSAEEKGVAVLEQMAKLL